MKKIFISFFLLSTLLASYNLTPKNFYRVINKKGVVVVFFWANWCAPCFTLDDKLKRVKGRTKGDILFAKYNVDLGGKPLNEYKIKYMPTIILFKNGKERGRITTSSLTVEEIIDWINKRK